MLFFFFSVYDYLFFFLSVGILYIGSSTQIVFFLILKLSFFLLVFESVAKRPLLSNLIDYCTVTCCVFNVLAHITPRYMLERKLTWFLFHDSDSTWCPYFPPFFCAWHIDFQGEGGGDGEQFALALFFSCYACYLSVALFCVFRLLFLPEWEHNDKAILCACFLFFFEEFSCLSLRVHYIRRQTLPNNRTPPFFFFLFCYMCLLMWVFALFMRVFFSWTWVLLKIMKERRRKKTSTIL